MEAIKAPMDANMGEGKWILASDAKEIGLVDEVVNPFTKAVASIDKSKLGYLAMNKLPDMEDVFSNTEPKAKAEDSATQNNIPHKEEEMDEKTMQALAKVVAEATVSAMDAKDAANAKALEDAAKAEAKAEKVEVPFEGDMENPEDVKAHAEKVKLAQLKASVDWNDPKSVMDYHKAISGEEPKAKAKVPQSGQDFSPSKPLASQNHHDTVKHFKKER